MSDVGAAIGGPILRDRLFFFGAIDPPWETPDVRSRPERHSRCAAWATSTAIAASSSYAAKGTWQVTSSHRFDASFFGDPAKGDMGPQRSSALLTVDDTSSFSEIEVRRPQPDGPLLRRRSPPTGCSRPRSPARLNASCETPSVNAWRVTDTDRDAATSSRGGIGFYEAGQPEQQLAVPRRSPPIIAGGHAAQGTASQLRGRSTYDQINQRTGPDVHAPDGEQTATGATIQILADPTFGQIYRVTRANLNSARTTTQNYVAFFVQDTWQVGERADDQAGPPLRAGDADRHDSAAGLLSSNEATGRRASAPPTILPATGSSKLYRRTTAASTREIPNDLAARALSADAAIAADYFDANLTQPIPNGVLRRPGSRPTTHYSLAGAGADVIDPRRQADLHARVRRRLRVQAGGEHRRRRALRAPQHRPRCSRTCSRPRSWPSTSACRALRQRRTTC